MKTKTTVEIDTRRAYADAHGNNPNAYVLRNLNFRADKAVSRDEAVAIMAKAMPHGYNEFDAKLLLLLPAFAHVTLARENSVCIYLEGKVNEIPAMKADEWDYDPEKNETRVWWD